MQEVLKLIKSVTSNQRWNNVLYINIGIYNVELRRINVVYFNNDINNVRQHWKNFVIFKVEFHNAGQRQKNVVNMTICEKLKNKPRV